MLRSTWTDPTLQKPLPSQLSDGWERRQKRLSVLAYSVLIVGLANLAAVLTFLVLRFWA